MLCSVETVAYFDFGGFRAVDSPLNHPSVFRRDSQGFWDHFSTALSL